MRLGIDYALTPEQTLTLAMQPRFNLTSADETLTSRQVNATVADQPVAAGTSRRANATTGTFRSADVTLDYRRVWDKQPGRELTANAVYTPLLVDNNFGSSILYLDNCLVAHQQRTTQATAQVDYMQPLSEKSRWEAGARSSLRQYDLDYYFSSVAGLGFDPSNRFVYKQYVQAACGLYV